MLYNKLRYSIIFFFFNFSFTTNLTNHTFSLFSLQVCKIKLNYLNISHKVSKYVERMEKTKKQISATLFWNTVNRTCLNKLPSNLQQHFYLWQQQASIFSIRHSSRKTAEEYAAHEATRFCHIFAYTSRRFAINFT